MLKAYRIRFISPASSIRSYTLFGAICWAYRLMGGNVKEFCEAFGEQPPFIISSPFPLLKENILLLPKPVFPVSSTFKREINICKKIERKPVKKAQYISLGVLQKVIDNRIREESAFCSENFYINKNVNAIFTEEELKKFDKEQRKIKDQADISVRNILNRQNMKSENLFTEERFYLIDRYVLFKYFYSESKYTQIVENCLSLIEDMGLGANKNLGWGKVKIEDISEKLNDELSFLDSKINNWGKLFLTLSPTLPRAENLVLDKSFYAMEVYKSPVDTTHGEQIFWKRKVIYVKEGSVLQPTGNGFVGQLKYAGSQDLGIDAYQYGFEFPIVLED